jgi:hypothetical protein
VGVLVTLFPTSTSPARKQSLFHAKAESMIATFSAQIAMDTLADMINMDRSFFRI